MKPPKPKFKIGQQVTCHRFPSKTWTGFFFSGHVKERRYVDNDSGWEYSVTNAPYIVPGYQILIWEHEIRPFDAITSAHKP